MAVISNTVARKVSAVIIGTLAFVAIGIVAAIAIGVPLLNAVVLAGYVGLAVGVFEVFFVQSAAGDRFRALRPVIHLLIYGLVVVAIYLIGIAIVLAFVAPASDRDLIIGRIPITLPTVFLISVAAVLVIRVISFLGARKLLDLLIGKYQRPIIEQRVFVFIDLKGSTRITERLGPLAARAFISRFLFDISKPITDRRGDIVKYMGDGLIASWSWEQAIADGNVIAAIIDALRKIEARAPAYRKEFGETPEFRCGVHGGEVVVSEQGDLRRSIEYNGDAINIAARLEQKAKEHGLPVIVSREVADRLAPSGYRFRPISSETVRGISHTIELLTLDPLPTAA